MRKEQLTEFLLQIVLQQKLILKGNWDDKSWSVGNIPEFEIHKGSRIARLRLPLFALVISIHTQDILTQIRWRNFPSIQFQFLWIYHIEIYWVSPYNRYFVIVKYSLARQLQYICGILHWSKSFTTATTIRRNGRSRSSSSSSTTSSFLSI
jgi:hypothetical protein